MTSEQQPQPAPGRYCLTVCYCGRCPHYQPLPPPRWVPPPPAQDERWR